MKDDRLVPFYCKKCDKVIVRALPGASVMCPTCRRWVKVEKGEKEA